MILGLIIFLLWLLFMTKNNILRSAIVLFFLFWQGIPAYNIWQADKLVDELCAKDGGINIYETVTLPKERFNQWGQFVIPPDKRYLKPNDEYFMQYDYETLKGDNDYKSLLPRVVRNHVIIFRVKDNKNMGEYISYVEGGGMAIGFSIVSDGHVCPNVVGFETQIFLNKK
jgi:hypothetical protein